MRDEILSHIAPLDEEVAQQLSVITSLRGQMIHWAEKLNQPFSRIEAQGSTGPKQTQLRGSGDIDLFIALNPENYGTVLSKEGKERDATLGTIMETLVDTWLHPALQEIGAEDIVKAYSQHPYLSANYRGFDVDLVLCFDLSKEELQTSGPITAVDRTIHHSEYVSKHLSSKSRDDVRILKSFLKAGHIYGDQSAIGRMGFTGYALELLIIALGGIDPAVKRIIHLESNPVDPLHRPLSVLRKQETFHDDHIFIIDPTDTSRNTASSFSPRAFKWLQLRTRSLLSALERGDTDTVLDLVRTSSYQIGSSTTLYSGTSFTEKVAKLVQYWRRSRPERRGLGRASLRSTSRTIGLFWGFLLRTQSSAPSS
jgi:tRNA nucleotidyltransferase (CCA-adding enzyme)